MRLHFLGSREAFERALLAHDFTEWSVGALARGRAWPGENLVPPDVAAHHLGPA